MERNKLLKSIGAVPPNMTNYQPALESGTALLLLSCSGIQSRHSHCQKINPNNSHLFGHKLNCLTFYLLKHSAQNGEEAEHMARAQRQGGLLFSQQPTVMLHQAQLWNAHESHFIPEQEAAWTFSICYCHYLPHLYLTSRASLCKPA